jgi:hypothetical protein
VFVGEGGNEKNCAVKNWPAKEKTGINNVRKTTLVNSENVLLPPLPIKFRCMNCVKVLNKGGKGFLYLHTKFPNLSDIKVKQGIFVSPQIRKVCLMRISKGN